MAFSLTSILKKVIETAPEALRLMTFRLDRDPVDSVDSLEKFVATRSAFVAQKTLYGYVKTRMGIRYPVMFEDPNIIHSLNIAKMHVFAACLSDFAIYAVGMALHGQPVGNEQRIALARRCFSAGMNNNLEGAPSEFRPQESIAEFGRRLEQTEWVNAALQPDNFTESPAALQRWAPIAEELKRFDAEIVQNSVKFAWRDIREVFRKRLNAAAVSADWSEPPSR